MFNRYQLIKGFKTHADAKAYADALPAKAIAKVVPYSTGPKTYAFAVDVSRNYVAD